MIYIFASKNHMINPRQSEFYKLFYRIFCKTVPHSKRHTSYSLKIKFMTCVRQRNCFRSYFLILYCLTHGYLDKLPVDDVLRYQAEIFSYFDDSHADLLKQIKDTGKLPEQADMDKAIEEMATAYGMKAEDVKERIVNEQLDLFKLDLAVQKAVDFVVDASVEVEKAVEE